MKKEILVGNYYLNQYNHRVYVRAIADDWAMVQEGQFQPFVLSVKELLAIANNNICYKTNAVCKYNCSGLCKESC